MGLMDLIIGTFVVGSTITGWRSGMVRQIIGLVMLLVAFVAGAYLRGPVGAIVAGLWTTLPEKYGEMVGYAIAFVAVFIIGNIVVGKLYGQTQLTGVSAMTDQAIGAVLGGLVAILIASSAIAILDTFYGQPNLLGKTAEGIFFLKFFHDGLESSWIADALRSTTVPIMLTILGPIIPKDIKLPFLK